MRNLIGLLLLPILTQAYTTTINLDTDSDCDIWSSNDMWADDEYNLRWNGKKLSDTCKIKFNNEDSNRKLCIKVNSYNINDCKVRITYYGGLVGSDFENSYSCYDYPSEFCGESYGDVAIKVDATRYSGSSYSSSFSIKVYSKSNNYPVIIGVSVSSSIIFSVVVLIVIIIVCRRRRLATRGALLTSYPPAGTTVVSNTSVVNSGGYGNPNYPSSQYPQQLAPPPPYSQTQYNQTPYPAQNYS